MKISILHTNDIHKLHYLPRLSVQIRQFLRDNPNSLVIDAGDMACLARHIKEPLGDVLPYDVIGLGNYDVERGLSDVARWIDYWRTPGGKPVSVVWSNAARIGWTPELGAKIERYVLIERRGIRIGVFALLGCYSKKLKINPIRLRSVYFESVHKTAKRYAKFLRRHAHLVIAICHLRWTDIVELAREVDGIDIILGGHTHRITGYWQVKNTVIGQSTPTSYRCGQLELEIKPNRRIGWTGKILPEPSTNDARLQAIVDRVQAIEREPLGLNRVIGTLPQQLWGERGSLRVHWFLVDAVREYAKADVALWTRPASYDLLKDVVKIGDINEICSPNDSVVSGEVTGRELYEIINHSIRSRWELVYSGLRVHGDTHAMDVGDSALDKSRTYRLAVSGWLAGGGGGFPHLPCLRRYAKLPLTLADIAKAKILKAGELRVPGEDRARLHSPLRVGDTWSGWLPPMEGSSGTQPPRQV